MMFRLSALILSLVCFLLGVCAEAKGNSLGNSTFDVFEVTKKTRTPFQAEQQSKWILSASKDQGKVLGWEVVLQSPVFEKFQTVQPKSNSSKAMLEGKTLKLNFFQMSEQFDFKGQGASLVLEIQAKEALSNKVVTKNCSRERIFLKPSSAILKAPFPMGTFCELEGENILLTISYPTEVDMVNSTIYEIAGKGESWRLYRIGKRGFKRVSLGDFVFSYQGQNYPFQLEYVPLKTQAGNSTANSREQFVGVAAGYSKLDVKGGVSTASDSKVLFTVMVPYYRLWKGLGVGGLIDWSFSIARKDPSVSYFQIELFSTYQIELRRNFNLRPKLGYANLKFENDITRGGVSGGQILVGIGTEFKFTDEMALTLDVSSLKFFSKIFDKSWDIQLSAIKKNSSGVGYGGGLRYQTLKGTTLDASGVELANLSLQAILFF